MQDKIKNLIKGALENLGIEVGDIILEHPADLSMGDYSNNVAMVCAKKLKTSPKELAGKIAHEMSRLNLDIEIEKIEVAGAGFINFYLSQKFFSVSVEKILNDKNFAQNNLYSGKKIMVEYTDPNPFKPFHIGHLMTNAIGESIARILEHSSAIVSRANYQGDVGLHVGKAIYGLLKDKKLQDTSGTLTTQAMHIGEAYTLGANAYKNDPKAKIEIDEVNKKIYDKSDEQVNKIYDWGFKVTMEAFEDLYRMLGTKFDFYFLESQMAPIGLNVIEENIGKAVGPDGRRIFEKSAGAIIFRGEKYDPKLHTRVFITSDGLPTYEGKELGLTIEKFKTVPDMDLSLVITANEQAEYMKVVAKAISLIYPEYESKMQHKTHGMMRFGKSSLGKMSSRKGNVITGESLLRDTKMLVSEKMKDRNFSYEKNEKIAGQVAVAALKYSILKQSTGGDIVYNFDKSISFEGDSGPYLQYSYARANSVLEKAKKENIWPDPHAPSDEISEVEKLLYRFPEIVLRSAYEYEPHHIVNYLVEVARAFNSFYGSTTIVNKEDPASPYKVALTFAFTFVMKKGLHLLGIGVPDNM